jgi:hypothetical protein
MVTAQDQTSLALLYSSLAIDSIAIHFTCNHQAT